MPKLRSIDHVARSSGVESGQIEISEAGPAPGTPGSAGESSGISRSRTMLAVGKSATPIGGGFGLETVLGNVDRRQRILETELFPWRMICALRIRSAYGDFIGTGWFIGPKTLLTAGHCVFHESNMGGWVTSIEVTPGCDDKEKPFKSTTASRFSVTDRWQESHDPDFDVGCIHLDKPLGEQTGWFSTKALSAKDLADWMVNVSGYPADKPAKDEPQPKPLPGTTQWHHRNRILRVSERRMFYDVDTYGGQSGSPVWIQETENAAPTAVGIHAYGEGGTPGSYNIKANSAPRFIPELMVLIQGWIESGGPSS